jgi:ubiquinone/menaquinone biosynthesis C-methylase UbiE
MDYYDARHKSLEQLLFTSIRSLLNEQSERLPAGLAPREDGRVLDVACGNGEWVRAMAQHYPAMEVVGLDTSIEAIRTARCLATHLSNARFQVGDMHGMTDIASESIDLVRACSVAPCVAPQDWHALIQEWLRICRPGGTLVWVESAFPQTNSQACFQWSELMRRAMLFSGKTPDVTPMMDILLADVGCQHLHKLETTINLSTGTDMHPRLHRNLSVVLEMVQPFLTNHKVASVSEIDRVCREAAIDVYGDGFLATWTLHTVTGEKKAVLAPQER